MKDCVIVVDNSNIWIEGIKYSARLKGMPAGPDGKTPCDYTWRIDFGKLLNVAADGKNIRKAILVGSRPPKNDSLWQAAKDKGFDVIVYDRNSQNKEKAIDTKLVAEGAKVIYKSGTEGPAVLKILSGDSDITPLVEIADEEGWESEIWAFSSSINPSAIPASVTRVELLDGHISEIELLNTKC